MKLLFLSPCIPSSNGTGWEQRAFCFLKAYSEIFSIELICCNFSGEKPTEERINSLHLICQKVLVFEFGQVILKSSFLQKCLRCFSIKPFFSSANFNFTFLNILYNSIKSADLIHVSRLELFSLIPSDYYSHKVILDLDECHFTAFQRKANYHSASNFRNKIAKTILTLDNFRVRYYQANAVRKALATCVSSEIEKSRLANFKPVIVVPNVGKILLTLPKIHNKFPKHFLFVGNLSAPANIDAVIYFTNKIFPKIIARDGDCEFHIVGRQPSPKILALTKYNKIKLTIDLPNIEEAYLNASVVVVPIRFGAGTKLKLLEAFGHGVPCVSTSLGCEGLSVRNKEHLLIADTPNKFANSCIQLLGDLELQREIADSAWRYVHQFHSSENIKTIIFDKLLASVTKTR